jgi:hypothetical protein
MRTRDAQRQKLYTAQMGLHFSIQDRMTLAEVRVFYDKLLGSDWAIRQFPKLGTKVFNYRTLASRPRPRVLLNPRLGRSTVAWHKGGDIELAGGEISKVTAVHELAHWIVSTLNRDWSVRKAPAGHGREFASVYLTLVGHVFGKDAQDMLRKAFVAHRVSYKAKRVLTGAALEAAQERGRKLAAARAAKKLSVDIETRSLPAFVRERHEAVVSFDREFLNG